MQTRKQEGKKKKEINVNKNKHRKKARKKGSNQQVLVRKVRQVGKGRKLK